MGVLDKIFGKTVETVVEKGAQVISELVKDKDLAAKLEHEFRSQLSKENHDLQALEIQAEKEIFQAQQSTIQAELHQSDLYTKRTRPKIARQSWYVAGSYALLAAVLPALPLEWGLGQVNFMWEVFLALAAPAMTYMGVRTVDLGISRLKGVK
jgi:hypothetical protein